MTRGGRERDRGARNAIIDPCCLNSLPSGDDGSITHAHTHARGEATEGDEARFARRTRQSIDGQPLLLPSLAGVISLSFPVSATRLVTDYLTDGTCMCVYDCVYV